MGEPQIPLQDTASDPEDPEYFEKCIEDYEERHQEYCDALLYRHLNGDSSIDVYAVPAESYGPDPFKYTRGNDRG
jgi:hypothetical protein